MAIFYLLAVGLVNLFIVSAHAHASEELLNDALIGLEKTLSFFAGDYSAINVDGLFGIRLGQGSINQSLEDCHNKRFRCPSKLVDLLTSLNGRIDELAEKAMPYIEADDPAYYMRFKYTFDAPYIVRYRIELLESSITDPGDNDAISEDVVDACYAHLFGTFIDEATNKTSPKCTITESCWKLMSTPSKMKYAITHQLLYFIMGENIGCLYQLDDFLKKTGGVSVREYERAECGKIYAETQAEERKDPQLPGKRDLFSEQCLLCGMLGFVDFYSEKRLHMLLSWQRKSGCFGSIYLDLKRMGINIEHQPEINLMDSMTKEAHEIDQSSATGRKLMREKPMMHGCLAHQSGISFGVLGGYIRLYVNLLYGPSSFEKRSLY